MKLFIKNGENNDEKIIIYINESSLVQDMKCKLDEILHGNGDFKLYCFKLIYKNMILSEINSIKYYKICENDEIWFGKVENYLTNDDVIVYVFIVGKHQDYDFVFVKKIDRISTITSIIERIHPKVINIWNADGKQMDKEQSITEVDVLKDFRLFIRCNDGETENKFTFQECCYIHNMRWVDRYLFLDRIRDNNKDERTRMQLMNFIKKIKQIIRSNDVNDDRLDQDLSDLPPSYPDSCYFFCGNMAIQIYRIYRDAKSFLMHYCQCRDDVVKIFATYAFFAIRAALVDFVNSRKEIRRGKRNSNNSISIEISTDKSNKSIRCIIIDALDYFVRYLNDSSNDWRYWMKTWTDQYILGSFSDFDQNKRIIKSKLQKFRIKLRTSGNYSEKFTTKNPKTIIAAKKTIADLLNIDMKHLYCIKPGGNHKPNDEDEFDDEFIIEIVMSMADIEILRYLAQGGYGDVFLCTDKISGNILALKKQHGAQRDLYRDISIQCQIRNCRNIINYLGLYNMNGNICFTMQYMSEGSIRSYLDEGKSFSENDLLKICYQILLQIRDIHKEGIIHRDIKCDNIVIDKHNNAKLIDFGLSKFTEDLSEDDLLKNLRFYKPGTVRFMAPEILKCEKYTNKIDIWSFGAAMIEMITGNIPYYCLSNLQAMLKIRNTGKIEFEPPESISQEIIELINLCLNSDPDERPSAEQLIRMKIFLKFKNIF